MNTQPPTVTAMCPECGKKIRLTVKREDEGKRVVVRCPCGQAIRTRLPDFTAAREKKVDRWFEDMMRQAKATPGNPYGL